MSDMNLDVTQELLRKIEIMLGDIGQQLKDMNARAGRMEETVRKQRRDLAGMLVMVQAIAGSRFKDEIDDIMNVEDEMDRPLQ
jgi:hypothetical protein